MRANPVIGVDVGGTKILAGVLTREGSVLRRATRPTPLSSQDDLLGELEAVLAELLDAGDGVAAIGLGVPSRIDQRSGEAITSTNVPLEVVPLRKRFAERFRLPVGLDNDANAAAIGEWAFGAGRGTEDFLMLTLGTGIGGGIVLDGKPYRGATGSAAELGHMVVQLDGPPCQGTCTGRGHLEGLASGQAADRAARSLIGPNATAADLVERARGGDEAAREAMFEIGRRLGGGIATLLNVFEPEVVAVGGSFGAAAFDLLLPGAASVIERDALVPVRDRVRIEPAVLGAEAGLVGAGVVAIEALDGSA